MTENLFDCFFYNNQTYAKSMMALEWNFCQASETIIIIHCPQIDMLSKVFRVALLIVHT